MTTEMDELKAWYTLVWFERRLVEDLRNGTTYENLAMHADDAEVLRSALQVALDWMVLDLGEVQR